MACAACDDLFEPNISEEKVTVYTPYDNDTIQEGVINFWWKELEGAETYRLVLTSGTPDRPEFLLIDSNIAGNQYSIGLTSGVYSWRLRAQNAASETEYEDRSFIVDTVVNLSNARVSILSPQLNDCINDTSFYVSWSITQIEGVRYQIEIRKEGFSTGIVLATFETSTDAIVIPLEADYEGEMSVGVRVVNDLSSGPFTSVDFSLDLSSPAKLDLLTPTDGDTIFSNEIQFAWEGSHDQTGCAESDSLVIYTDENLTQVYTSTIVTGTQEVELSLPNGDYWCRVLRVDKAGNKGAFSQDHKFKVVE